MIIKTVNKLPNIVLYEDVFSDEELETLSFKTLEFKKSLGMNMVTFESEKTDARTSDTAFLPINESRYIHEKVSSLINDKIPNLRLEQFELVQIQKYSAGERYVPHWDFFNVSTSKYENDRIATAIVYLNDDFRGGHTSFPYLDKEIKPKKGSVLFFLYNYDNTTNKITMHSGNPVEFETKYIASVWIRKNPINE